MGEDHVTHAEFRQYEKRMEEWKAGVTREFNGQIEALKELRRELKEDVKGIRDNMMQIHTISENTKEIRTDLTHIKTEQKSQGDKLERMEGRDGDMWRKVLTSIIAAAAGLIIGFLFKGGF